ncbi:MAG: Rne/Rng family ribonuclease [Desulfobacteraceae bacterium]|nr:Rne/Rng family ribonuclease [Desulfobacteraceae bacterium]MCF8094009.1 Rne/Rng family ribonuclease [Desulfobacteraceae bacterium]
MDKELIINALGPEIRVALLENSVLTEIYVERQDESNIAGNIYKGRIQRVLPGMQAAFVEAGLKQAAFIYVDDVLNGQASPPEGVYINNENTCFEEEAVGLIEDNGPISAFASRTPRPDRRPIEEVLKEGQEILVQVARSPIGSKGARLTTCVSLPGRFLVLMPSVDHIGISRRITDESERIRLKEMAEDMRTRSYGYIVRTAGEGVDREVLAREMEFLDNLWNDIQQRYQEESSPALLHEELTVTLRCVRDLLAHEADKVTIDSPAVYKTVRNFIEKFMPRLGNSVVQYTGSEPIFDAYNLEIDIQRALKKKVWLKCGGYIIIEITEALVAIDVNTGRYVGKRNFAETVLKTNLEAVKEIAYQIRLRNLGGIIIIDFIDMESRADQEKVYNTLQEALSRDKAKTNVLPMSDMGLIQMTRKRVVKSLPRMLCEPCFYCEGEGMLLSRRTVCYNIFRDVCRKGAEPDSSGIHLKVHPVIADLLLGQESGLISMLEDRIGCQIVIYPDDNYHLEQYEITEVR